jgi:hypothetical protein
MVVICGTRSRASHIEDSESIKGRAHWVLFSKTTAVFDSVRRGPLFHSAQRTMQEDIQDAINRQNGVFRYAAPLYKERPRPLTFVLACRVVAPCQESYNPLHSAKRTPLLTNAFPSNTRFYQATAHYEYIPWNRANLFRNIREGNEAHLRQQFAHIIGEGNGFLRLRCCV